MASYYHEARAEKKLIKTTTEANKRKAERRAELAGVEAEQPFDLLRIDGRSCKLFRNTEQRTAVEAMEGFLPWNGKEDNLIDRFDGRALLDFYREPDGRLKRPKTDDELELEELLAFESYRDLVKTARQSEAAGLAAAQEANLALRAAARSAAAEGAGATAAMRRAPVANPATPAGFGAYGAVGFSYGGEAAPALPPPPRPVGAAGPAEESDDSDFSDSDSDDNAPKTLNEQEREDFANSFGIRHFDSTLRRAERDEQAEAEGRVPKPRRAFSRKKAAQRAKRMAGQGLVPPGGSGPPWESRDVKPPLRPSLGGTMAPAYRRRDSPSYEEERFHNVPWQRDQSRSRSPSPAQPRTQYITSFSSDSAPAAAAPYSRETGAHVPLEAPGHREILPSRGDQDSGPVQIPAEANTMRGISADDYWAKQREEEHASRAEQRRKEREKETQKQLRKQPAAKAAASKAKETPQERLKRLMAAQINKQQAKDSVSIKQRQQQEEKDAAARRQIERAAYAMDRRRSPSPRYRHRSRSRSYSPRGRGRSRSRSRSPRRYEYAPSLRAHPAAVSRRPAESWLSRE